MANNSQPPGGQQIWPPSSGTMSSPNFAPQMNMQYRPMVPGQQGQQYFSTASQQFRPVGQVMPSGGPDLRPQYSHSVQQLPQRAGQPLHTHPMHYVQANMPLPSGSPQPQQGAAGVNVVSSYRPQTSANAPSEVPPMPHMHAPVGQPWATTGGQGASAAVAAQQTAQQPVTTSSADSSASDWQEHEAANGRRYYYNKKTKQSSWDKPSELMTPIERADASTVWKEFTTADGRKYYNHKVTKQSVWTMPEEMKLARERALREAAGLDGSGSVSQGPSSVPETVETSVSTSAFPGMASSPLPVTLVAPVPSATPGTLPGSTPVAASVGTPNSVADQNLLPSKPTTPFSPASVNANSTPRNDNVPTQDIASSGDGPSFQHNEEARNGTSTAGKVNVTSKEEKPQEDEPFLYSSKQEAKNAFKALLESVNVQSDWSWEQAMREIVNDRRYGALKTLGERKQAFNEYLGQRKKVEAEERRIRQKKAREEFTKMLEESEELTSSVKWSKAISMFENDERFKAVERNRDREDLYESYIVDLARKEREKAAEEHRHNIMEYKEYLQSCDFIKVSSQWRKILERLEDDDRCSRLEKIDRLLVFQDYIRDLEVEEEEEKKKQKDQIRRSERKNRDEFRKLMDSHVAEGILTAKTYWRDYCLKVRDAPEYEAVVSNTSGSTPRDLFEDVLEDLENQYHEDKSRVKDVMKTGKISSVSTWAFEDFKAAIMEDIGEPGISDINMKLVFEELLERAKEKEEKEAKKRQRLADDFTSLLHDTKEITMSSNWDECKPLVEESQEFTSIGDESAAKELFEEYIIYLQEKAKDKERKKEEEKARKEEKERRKEKERKERDKERERERGKEKSKKDESDSDTAEVNDTYKEDRKREKDKDRKHRKRHPTASDDVYSDKDEKDSKRSKRHSSDRKKSKKHAHSPESDSESRHKRHKRDRDGSRRNGDHEELEDGEVGEDGEIQ